MTQHNRETLEAALSRIPETDLFARMLLVGKIKSLDRATLDPTGEKS